MSHDCILELQLYVVVVRWKQYLGLLSKFKRKNFKKIQETLITAI